MTTATPTRVEVLTSRLQNLQAERDELLGELVVGNGGDTADRATNVDANARLSLVEQRISAVEFDLHQAQHTTRGSGTGVAVGDVVTVDLGDGPETFLFAGVEQADNNLDVISPASPLGRAIAGATVGSAVTYSPRARVELTATVVAIS